MADVIHHIKVLDVEERKGLCSIDGIVKIYPRDKGETWECGIIGAERYTRKNPLTNPRRIFGRGPDGKRIYLGMAPADGAVELRAPAPRTRRDDYSDPGSRTYTRAAQPEIEVQGRQAAIHEWMDARGLLKPGDEIAHGKRGKQVAADIFSAWERKPVGRVWVDAIVLTDENVVRRAEIDKVKLPIIPAEAIEAIA